VRAGAERTGGDWWPRLGSSGLPANALPLRGPRGDSSPAEGGIWPWENQAVCPKQAIKGSQPLRPGPVLQLLHGGRPVVPDSLVDRAARRLGWPVVAGERRVGSLPAGQPGRSAIARCWKRRWMACGKPWRETCLVLGFFRGGAGKPAIACAMRSCWRRKRQVVRVERLHEQAAQPAGSPVFRGLRFRALIQVEKGREGLDLRVGEAAAPLLGLRLQRKPASLDSSFREKGRSAATRWRVHRPSSSNLLRFGARCQHPGPGRCSRSGNGGPTRQGSRGPEPRAGQGRVGP